MAAPTEKLFYKLDEVAELTGIGRTRLFKLIGEGELASVKVGKSRLVPAASLEAFAAKLAATAA
jgi:excisionase family DNA binding protein